MIKNIFGHISLNDGQTMPGYGYGVYKAHGQDLISALQCAFDCGYRYIDTASFYQNEKEVGKGIKNSSLPRAEIFIISKIWPTQFKNPAHALKQSLCDLGLDYLDAYLLHWPGLDAGLRLNAYEALLQEKEKGLIKNLGVSNFPRQLLEELHSRFGIWPAINQIEIHPLYQEKDLRAFCREQGIQVVCWSPLGRARALTLPAIAKLARDLGKTPAQVILRWHVQQDLIPIPKSVHADRIRENADIFDFNLDPAQMDIINALDLPNHEGRAGKDPLLWPPLE